MGQPITRALTQIRFGLNTAADQETCPADQCLDMKNWYRFPNGSLSTRPGFQFIGSENASAGLPRGFAYKNRTYPFNPPVFEDEIVIMRGSPTVYRPEYFSVSAPTAHYLQIVPVAGVYRCILTKVSDGTVTLSQSLGAGYDANGNVTGTYTVGNLVTAINAIAGWLAAASASSVLAVNLPQTPYLLIDPAGLLPTQILYYYSSNTVYDSIADNSDLSANQTSVIINDVLYTGGSRLAAANRYDGLVVITSGLPVPTACSTALGAAGALTGDYSYITTFEYTDYRLNFIESIASEASTPLTTTSDRISVSSIDSSLAGVGDPRIAYATSNQVGVTTIAVDDGAGGAQPFLAGDVVWFLDGASATYLEKTVLSVTTTSIQVSGAVNVLNNEPISKVRVNLYRNKAGGTDYYLAATLPLGQTTYTDNTTDVNLGAKYIYPLLGETHEHGIDYSLTATTGRVAVSKWLSSYAGKMIASGNTDLPSTVYFSSEASPEYWPPSNSFTLSSGLQDSVTCHLGYDDYLLVFLEKSIFRVTGVLSGGASSATCLSKTIGCVSPTSLKDISDGGATRTIFLASDNCFYEIVNGAPPVIVSRDIVNLIEPTALSSLYKNYLPTGAKAVNWKSEGLYLCYVPVALLGYPATEYLTSFGGESRSVVLVYDYTNGGQWYRWQDLYPDQSFFLFQERPMGITNQESPSADCSLFWLSDRYDQWAAYDQVYAITTHFELGPEAFGDLDSFKNCLDVRISSLDSLYRNNATLTYKSFINDQASAHTTASVVFDNDNRRVMKKLKGTKAQYLRHRVEHSVAGEKPVITKISTKASLDKVPEMKTTQSA